MAKEKFYKTLEKWVDVSKKLREDCLEFLTRKLNETENKRIEWDYDECEELGLPGVSVPYDGGNHPEYASNVFSDVWGVFLDKDGKVNFILNDCDEYEEERLESGEVCAVAQFLDDLLRCRKIRK